MTKLDIRSIQVGIKTIKDSFERELAERLNLIRVSAPMFVKANTGINDNLSGREKPVSFKMRQYNEEVEIVQSLAKWKRMALKRYDFRLGEGLYTDMNAIRPDEVLDASHSLYVDQWDWEKIIEKEDRNEDFLRATVKTIYQTFKLTERTINKIFPSLTYKLPDEIFFISSQELEDLYPRVSPAKREDLICEKHGAVFLMEIGNKLKSGLAHDTRSPDYDDWNLNGDILFWNPVLGEALELSSMGIRVDSDSLMRQLEQVNAGDRKELIYHQKVLQDKLPQTIGGGIGQSRMCMYFLERKHIGEVQASVWTEEVEIQCQEENIFLL